jgi:hypothetical protein
METNDRLKVADCEVCKGKPIAADDPAKSAVEPRRVSRKTLWGLSMVLVALFRFCMTWALNVTPEPVNVTLTAIIGLLGMTLFVWGRLNDRVQIQTPEKPRHQ